MLLISKIIKTKTLLNNQCLNLLSRKKFCSKTPVDKYVDNFDSSYYKNYIESCKLKPIIQEGIE